MLLKAASQVKVKVELKPVVDNLVFKLHYRYTYIFFVVATALATLYDAIGNKIDCLTGIDSDSFQDAVNSYCFIMGTFTVDRLHSLKEGSQVPHPGVGPPEAGDSITYHTYYQWVPFVLFVQGILFYVPHWLWKMWEGGLFKSIIQDLSIKDYLDAHLKNYFGREERYEALSKYVSRTMHGHKAWAYRFFLCEFLNLVVVVGMLFFTDWFLGGEFLKYGTSVFEVTRLDPENRTDPMSYVFPRMAKCTFRSFGASGTIQVRDVMCLIATNIINEKIYLFLWVWLVLLTAITSAWMIYRLLTLILPPFRNFLLMKRTDHASQDELKEVLRYASVSDWFLLHSLAKNMERSIFSEFVLFLYRELRHSAETLPRSLDDQEALKEKLRREDSAAEDKLGRPEREMEYA